MLNINNILGNNFYYNQFNILSYDNKKLTFIINYLLTKLDKNGLIKLFYNDCVIDNNLNNTDLMNSDEEINVIIKMIRESDDKNKMKIIKDNTKSLYKFLLNNINKYHFDDSFCILLIHIISKKYSFSEIKKLITKSIEIYDMSLNIQVSNLDLEIEYNKMYVEYFKNKFDNFNRIQYNILKKFIIEYGNENFYSFFEDLVKNFHTYKRVINDEYKEENIVDNDIDEKIDTFFFLPLLISYVENDILNGKINEKQKNIFINLIEKFIINNINVFHSSISLVSSLINITTSFNNNETLKNIMKEENEKMISNNKQLKQQLEFIDEIKSLCLYFPEIHTLIVEISNFKNSIKGNKKNIQTENIELIKTINSIFLRKFLNEIYDDCDEINKIIKKLNKIGIIYYSELMQLIFSKKFIQRCTINNKFILKKEDMKLIIYYMHFKNKIDIECEEDTSLDTNNVNEDYKVINYTFIPIKSENKSNNFIFNELKEKRIHLVNIINLNKKAKCNYSIYEKELIQIENKILSLCIDENESELITENIEYLKEIINNISNGDTSITNKVKDIMENYYKQNAQCVSQNGMIKGDKFGISNSEMFNKDENSNIEVFNGSAIGKKLEKALLKQLEEEEKEEKEENKKIHEEKQKKMIINTIENCLNQLVIMTKISCDNLKHVNKINDFINKNEKILKVGIYKFLSSNSELRDKYNEIIIKVVNIFTIIYFLNKIISSKNDINGFYTTDIKYVNEEDFFYVNEPVIYKPLNIKCEIKSIINEDIFIEVNKKKIICKKEELLKTNIFLNKNIKIIRKHQYKGFYGRVFKEFDKYVMATLDIHGKITEDYITSLKVLKINKENITIVGVQQYETRRTIYNDNSEIFKLKNKKTENLSELTKIIYFDYFDKNINNEFQYFTNYFKVSSELFNELINYELGFINKLNQTKKDYINLESNIKNEKDNKKILLKKKEIASKTNEIKILMQTLIKFKISDKNYINNLFSEESYNVEDNFKRLRIN